MRRCRWGPYIPTLTVVTWSMDVSTAELAEPMARKKKTKSCRSRGGGLIMASDKLAHTAWGPLVQI